MDTLPTRRSADREGGKVSSHRDLSPWSGPLRRFTVVERLSHWVYAVLYLGALATGLLMWIPASRAWMGASRQTVAHYHGAAAVAMIVLPLLLFLALDRRSLSAGLREVDLWDERDRRWLGAALRGRMLRGGKVPPQGRFNAGQKTYTVVVAVMSLGFLLTGSLLLAKAQVPAWLVSRALWLHGFLAVSGAALLLGHLAQVFLTKHGRASLRAMFVGTYPAQLAQERHRLWWEKMSTREMTAREEGG